MMSSKLKCATSVCLLHVTSFLSTLLCISCNVYLRKSRVYCFIEEDAKIKNKKLWEMPKNISMLLIYNTTFY